MQGVVLFMSTPHAGSSTVRHLSGLHTCTAHMVWLFQTEIHTRTIFKKSFKNGKRYRNKLSICKKKHWNKGWIFIGLDEHN